MLVCFPCSTLFDLVFRRICKSETKDVKDGYQTGGSTELVGEVHGHDSVCIPDLVESTLTLNKSYGLIGMQAWFLFS